MKKVNRLCVTVAMLTGLVFGSTNGLASVTSGYLNDASNPALVASDGFQNFQAPRFGNDDEIARNVAIYELTVTTPGSISFSSTGFAASGVEPYFTLFSGSGMGATFLDSNYFSPDIDFSLGPYALGVGVYMFAVGVWSNLSFAENLGTGSLGDAFTALGDPTLLGNSFYQINITSTDAAFHVAPAGISGTPIPEPASMLLVILSLMILAVSNSLKERAALRRIRFGGRS